MTMPGLMTLSKCPPGPFLYRGTLGFKTEYGAMEADGPPDVYMMSSGEVFWGGATSKAERDGLMVLPLEISDLRRSPGRCANPGPACSCGKGPREVQDCEHWRLGR